MVDIDALRLQARQMRERSDMLRRMADQISVVIHRSLLLDEARQLDAESATLEAQAASTSA